MEHLSKLRQWHTRIMTRTVGKSFIGRMDFGKQGAALTVVSHLLLLQKKRGVPFVMPACTYRNLQRVIQ